MEPINVLHLAPRHEDVLGEWRYSSTYSLTSALDGCEWSASHPGRFISRERANGTDWIGGWVGPRVGLNSGEEINPGPLPGLEPHQKKKRLVSFQQFLIAKEVV
jgi:hypothetical protein